MLFFSKFSLALAYFYRYADHVCGLVLNYQCLPITCDDDTTSFQQLLLEDGVPAPDTPRSINNRHMSMYTPQDSANSSMSMYHTPQDSSDVDAFDADKADQLEAQLEADIAAAERDCQILEAQLEADQLKSDVNAAQSKENEADQLEAQLEAEIAAMRIDEESADRGSQAQSKEDEAEQLEAQLKAEIAAMLIVKQSAKRDCQIEVPQLPVHAQSSSSADDVEQALTAVVGQALIQESEADRLEAELATMLSA